MSGGVSQLPAPLWTLTLHGGPSAPEPLSPASPGSMWWVIRAEKTREPIGPAPGAQGVGRTGQQGK